MPFYLTALTRARLSLVFWEAVTLKTTAKGELLSAPSKAIWLPTRATGLLRVSKASSIPVSRTSLNKRTTPLRRNLMCESDLWIPVTTFEEFQKYDYGKCWVTYKDGTI